MNRSPREPEIVSDDVVIWEYGSEAGDSYYPYSDPYGSLQKPRQIPNLYSKNQIEWASDQEGVQWTPSSDVVRTRLTIKGDFVVDLTPMEILIKH